MRSSWRVVGVVLTVLAVLCGAGLRAEPPPSGVEATAPTNVSDTDRAALKKDVAEERYERAEETLEKLRRGRLQAESGKSLLGQEASMDALEKAFDEALDAGHYGVAQYYLEQIRTKAESPAIFKPALDLTIWTVVVFLLLLAVLYRFAWKPMLQGLSKRETDIHSAVEDARKAREEAQRLRDEILAERAKIEESRRETIHKAETDAQRRAEEIASAAEAKLKAEREQALRELASAKDQALQDIWRQTADLAAMVSSKAIRRNLTPDDHRRLVDEALAELHAAGNGHKTTASV